MLFWSRGCCFGVEDVVFWENDSRGCCFGVEDAALE